MLTSPLRAYCVFVCCTTPPTARSPASTGACARTLSKTRFDMIMRRLCCPPGNRASMTIPVRKARLLMRPKCHARTAGRATWWFAHFAQMRAAPAPKRVAAKWQRLGPRVHAAASPRADRYVRTDLPSRVARPSRSRRDHPGRSGTTTAGAVRVAPAVAPR